MSPFWSLSSGEHISVSLETSSVYSMDPKFKINYISGLIIFMSMKSKSFSSLTMKWSFNQVSYP